jgi:hypothetical protein
MAKPDKQPTQKTQPAKGKPVEIPIPTREAVIRDLMKTAPPVERPAKQDSSNDS